MWNFLMDNLNTSNSLLTDITLDGSVLGLSTDLEEATDYGNPYVAQKIFDTIIDLLPEGSPVGLFHLSKKMFCSERNVFYRTSSCPPGYYKMAKKIRGWFMGDPMTKYLLAICQ